MPHTYWQSRVGSKELLGLLAEACKPDRGAMLHNANWAIDDSRNFADTWRPSLPGLGKLLYRLMGQAGLGNFDLKQCKHCGAQLT